MGGFRSVPPPGGAAQTSAGMDLFVESGSLGRAAVPGNAGRSAGDGTGCRRTRDPRVTDVNQSAKSDIEALREEVDKLSRVITEVMGEEFDTIMTRQVESQRSILRWMIQSLSVSVATMQLLVEHGVLEQDECHERISKLQQRLLAHSEAVGSDVEIADLLGRAQDEQQQ